MIENDYTWKIVVGGSGGVGKTTIIHRYIMNEFIADTKMTVGVQFQSLLVDRGGKKIAIVIWDLGGQERFRFVQPGYVKGSLGAFVLYDMGRYETLYQVSEWIELFKKNCVENAPIILVGTKYDVLKDENEAALIMNEAEACKKEYNLTAHVVTSAKLGYNVTETMLYMVDLLLFKEVNG